jgi:hypothetical protein
MRIVVVLPAPLGPTKPQIVPVGTENVASERAARFLYLFVRPCTSIAFLLIGVLVLIGDTITFTCL